MKNFKLSALLLIAALLVVPFNMNGQLLKGKFLCKPLALEINFSPDGDPFNSSFIQIEVMKDGSFTFDKGIEVPFVDATLYIGESSLVGVHLVKGKTLELYISENQSGSLEYEFGGEYKKISQMYTQFASTFDLFRYFPMGEEKTKSYSENVAWMNSDLAILNGMISKIKDKT